MSHIHLEDIRKALEQNHWVIADELDGNGYDISGVWAVERPDGSNRFHIEFNGLHESRVLPMNEAYGCHIRENKSISAYFSRKNRSWPSELISFIEALKNFSCENIQTEK